MHQVPNKREGGLKNCIGQKWQPDITNYGCPKQLLIVEKHQYNFSCSLHLYIKQNRMFLITNLSNVNTKSCLRNQTRLCIHLLVLLVPSCSLTHCFWGFVLCIKPKNFTLHYTDFQCQNQSNLHEAFQM